MVQIVEHRGLSPEDFLMEEEVVSSMPRGSNRPTPGAAAVHAARQHTPAVIQGTIKGCSLGAVCSQGVAAPPSELHGLVRNMP
jgi:hypothetical protein